MPLDRCDVCPVFPRLQDRAVRMAARRRCEKCDRAPVARLLTIQPPPLTPRSYATAESHERIKQ